MKILSALYRLARRIFGQHNYPKIIPADFEPQHEAPVIPEHKIAVPMSDSEKRKLFREFTRWLREESQKGQDTLYGP